MTTMKKFVIDGVEHVTAQNLTPGTKTEYGEVEKVVGGLSNQVTVSFLNADGGYPTIQRNTYAHELIALEAS